MRWRHRRLDYIIIWDNTQYNREIITLHSERDMLSKVSNERQLYVQDNFQQLQIIKIKYYFI